MGKRSSFERKERDYYPTPLEAVVPLVPHLPTSKTLYHEPCAGNGALISHLDTLAPHMLCLGATDVKPDVCHVGQQDALTLTQCFGDMFITNPPWRWDILDPLITHLSTLAPVWLLLNADQMHNKRVGPHLKRCVKIVSVGRVKWEPDSKGTGMENAAWYLFDTYHRGATEFVGR